MTLHNTIRNLIHTVLIGAVILLLCSFGHGYDPFGYSRIVTPEKEAVLEESGIFAISGKEGLYMPMAAYGRILAMSRMGSYNRIAAVDTEDGRILGEYLTDSEMSSVFSECQYRVKNDDLILYLHDFTNANFYSMNLSKTVSTGNEVLSPLGKLPGTVAFVTFLHDSTNMLSHITPDGRAVCEKIGFEGDVLASWELFPKADPHMLKTMLAYRVAPDVSGIRAAIAMTFLPVLGIIDLSTGEIRYVQYSKDFDMKRISDKFLRTGEYPGDSFVSRLYTYDQGICIVRTCFSDSDDEDFTEILMFDWNGTFKYKYSISKAFTSTALDFRNSLLYGGEGQSTIYVYNLTDCL